MPLFRGWDGLVPLLRRHPRPGLPDPPVEAVLRDVLDHAVGHQVPDRVPVTDPVPAPVLAELETATTRVVLARSFHNATVADTRAVRLRRMPRALHLAGHRALPQFFEIDDTYDTSPRPASE